MTEAFIEVAPKDLDSLFRNKVSIPKDYKVSGVDVYRTSDKLGTIVLFFTAPDLPEDKGGHIELKYNKTPNGIFVNRYTGK